VLRWNFENIAVETDKAGNKSFHKGKSRDRIDDDSGESKDDSETK
jgi:hypothetical protein